MKKLLLLICLLWNTTSYADTEEKEYQFYGSKVPIICSTPQEVERYVVDNKFVPITISVGREGSTPEGSIVFLITYYISDTYETLVTLDVPNGIERCILFHTFNLVMNADLLSKKDT